MKKIVALIALVVLASTGSAFAAAVDGADTDGGKTIVVTGATSKVIGKLSASVRFGRNCATTGYAIITSHKNGTKTFGTAHNANSVFSKDSLDTTGPTASDASFFATTGWTSL